jgi:hypothetical protein
MIKALFGISILMLALPAITFASVDHDIKGKNPGDIIAPLTDSQIADWCDFTRQIVKTNTNVLCVYKGVNNGAGYPPPT